MKRKNVSAPMEDINESSYQWVDENLDEDALDLDEWAFMHGYYEEV